MLQTFILFLDLDTLVGIPRPYEEKIIDDGKQVRPSECIERENYLSIVSSPKFVFGQTVYTLKCTVG